MVDSPIIVALDFPDARTALALAKQLRGSRCQVKVGKELFTRAGPSIIEALHQLDFDVFLDLKFHDIPHTTARASAAAADLGVWMFNVHAAGGHNMLTAAREAIDHYSHRPKLIAVTVLTSLQQDDLQAIGLRGTPEQAVLRLAKLAHTAGLDGVVCSPQEIEALRATMPADFSLVTPGIRPAHSAKDDQKRTLTPLEAIQADSDYLVIGRPITAAIDPLQALNDIQATLGV